MAVREPSILLQLDAARAYHAATRKPPTPQHVPIDPRGLIGTWTPEPINPQELSSTPPKDSVIADKKRSDIEKIILPLSIGLQYDAQLYSPAEQAIVFSYFFGTSNRGHMPCDINVTNPDYLPTTKDKSSILSPVSTSPTCPMDILSPKAFVDNQEVLLYAKRSDTISCSKYLASQPISNYC